MKSILAIGSLPALSSITGAAIEKIQFAGFTFNPADAPPWITSFSMILACLYLRNLVKENKEKHDSLESEDKVLHGRVTEVTDRISHLEGAREESHK